MRICFHTLNPAAPDSDYLIRHVLQRGVMRDHDHQLSLLAGQGVQQLQNFLARDVVQRAGRLIAKDQLRVFRNGAGNRNALLFAAGELGGKVVNPLAETASPTDSSTLFGSR